MTPRTLSNLTRLLNLIAAAGEVVLVCILIRYAVLAGEIFAWSGTAR